MSSKIRKSSKNSKSVLKQQQRYNLFLKGINKEINIIKKNRIKLMQPYKSNHNEKGINKEKVYCLHNLVLIFDNYKYYNHMKVIFFGENSGFFIQLSQASLTHKPQVAIPKIAFSRKISKPKTQQSKHFLRAARLLSD